MPEPAKNQGTPPPKEYIFTEVVDTLYVFDGPAIQDEEYLSSLPEPRYLNRQVTHPSSDDVNAGEPERPPQK